MKWANILFVSLAISMMLFAGIVVAEDTSDTTSTTDTTDYVARSLDIRYDNLICKIDFTTAQIDVIDKYANSDYDIVGTLLDDKDMLLDDKDGLTSVYDDGNLTEFNDYVSETLHPDFNETMTDLREFKQDYKSYIDENDTADFRDELMSLVETYRECTSTRTQQMGRLMDQYYKGRENMWGQIIKSMEQRGLNTTEMEQVREQLQERLQIFENAVNSGNQTRLQQQLQIMKEEHLQLWTRFHSGRLNSFLNRIEPSANQYGRSADIERIRGELNDIKPMMNGTWNNTWNSTWNGSDATRLMLRIHQAADDMQEMSEGMARQRGRNR